MAHLTRILIADAYPVLVVGVRGALSQDGGFEVVAEAHSGPEVIPLVGRHTPDVVLLDLHLPGLDGLAALDRIRAGYPDVKMVMFSSATDPQQIEAAFRHGAVGFVVKSVAVRDLASAIHQAVEGTAYHAYGLPAISGGASVAQSNGLTGRELEIVQGVADGRSNREIAQGLWITEQTVKFHLTNTYRKLRIENRTGLARWAYERGLHSNAQTVDRH